MIERIEIRTSRGAIISIPVTNNEAGYIVRKIEGLDPVPAALVSSSFAQMDGQEYQSSRRETRNIKLELGLEPNYLDATIRQLRNRLYKYFMPETELQLTLYVSDGLQVSIGVVVETFESELFSDDPSASISMIAFDPDFYDPARVVVNGYTTSGDDETTIEYDGTIETGVVITMDITREMDSFTIYHRPPDGSFRSMDFAGGLEPGDDLMISTIPGEKAVIQTRENVDASVLYALSPTSAWLELLPGDNYIRIYAEGSPIEYKLEYTTKYGGL